MVPTEAEWEKAALRHPISCGVNIPMSLSGNFCLDCPVVESFRDAPA